MPDDPRPTDPDLDDLSPRGILRAIPEADEPEAAGPQAPGEQAAQEEAAREEAAQEEARSIYAEILRRTPEHDFDPRIDRVQMLMELLGDPQHAFRSIHITGTNGKTSTARMIEQLLHEMGLRTGRFTSPHLHDVRERITIDTRPIPASRFVEVWHDIEPYVQMVDSRLEAEGRSPLSFFEVLSAFAFAAFADAPVDVAVVEVGMGGEWDSTNVIAGDVAVFTPVATDHAKWLGATPEEIAATKAGIIKDIPAGQILVTAAQPEEVEVLLAERARERRARVLAQGYDLEVADRRVGVGGQLLSLRTPAATYTDIFLPLFGAHQGDNALLALSAVEAFLGGGALPGEVVEAGFGAVTSPGRLELVRSSPAVIVDAAHNPSGARALAAAIEEAFTFTRLVGVVGMMADKDADGIFAELEGILDEVVITEVRSMRSLDVADLAEIARDTFDPDDVHEAATLPDAIALAVDLAEQGQVDAIAAGTGVLVAGSVVLAAEARALFGHGMD